MDGVDAVQAQIARNTLHSGDWITARLDGIVYLEKPPLQYWLIAVSYPLFGVHDWAARLPFALSAIALCWLTLRFGAWAFGTRAGARSGLVLATCIGLWLFTRTLVSDVLLTLANTASMWALLRMLDDEEDDAGLWRCIFGASIGAGFLANGMIGVVFPCLAGAFFLALTHRFAKRETWRQIRIGSCLAPACAVALPWVAFAAARNPPWLDFAMQSRPGEWHGFRFFLHEHLFRFLTMRCPRDSSNVPGWAFRLSHLLWLFPWSAYLPAAVRLHDRSNDRAESTRVFCLCWIGVVLLFIPFSTTQAYDSTLAYPAFALLIGAAFSCRQGQRGVLRWGSRAAGLAALAAGLACLGLLAWTTPGGLSTTLFLGRAQDLTPAAFASLCIPLGIAASAFLVGAAGAWRRDSRFATASLVLMMLLFSQGVRLALAVSDPYLCSKPLAAALNRQPAGTVVHGEGSKCASIFLYADLPRAMLLHGCLTHFEYGSYQPAALHECITDDALLPLWRRVRPCYLAANTAD